MKAYATHVGYRPDLEAPPDRIRKLAIYRGFPVPWFVDWVPASQDGGTVLIPEFRAMDGEKLVAAINQRLCWVCGEGLGKFMTFVAGPMCGINRTSAEPPSHDRTQPRRNPPLDMHEIRTLRRRRRRNAPSYELADQRRLVVQEAAGNPRRGP